MLQSIGSSSTIPSPNPSSQTPKTPYETKPVYEQRNSDGSTFISALTYAKAKETFFKEESVTPVGKAFDAFLFSPPIIKAGKAFEAFLFSAPVAAVGRVLNNIACYALGICEEAETENEIAKTKNIEHIEHDNIDEERPEASIEPLNTQKRNEEFSPPAWTFFMMSTSYQNNMNVTQKFTPCDSVQRNIIFINENSTGFQRDKLNITLEFGPSCSSTRRACIDQYLGDYFTGNKTIVRVPDTITIDSDFWEYNVSSFYSSYSWRLTCQGEHRLLMTFLNELQTSLDNVVDCDNQAYKKYLMAAILGTAGILTILGVGCCVWKNKRDFACKEEEYIDLEIQPNQIIKHWENNDDQQSKPLMVSQKTNYRSIHSTTL